MTFGAMAAWQAMLLVGAAAAVAAGLFLVKLRPPRVVIPSLMLWRRVLDETRELTLWERIRRAVSLAITVLVALAMALAITRPGRAGGAAAANSGRTLIVLDSSFSMQARTSSGETRWERALAEARRIVAAASGAEVALATTADGIVEGPTTDGSLIDAALERIRPAGGDLTAWPQVAGTAVHFVTDGALVRPIGSGVVVHSVYEAASNVAVTAFDVRPSLVGTHAGDTYVEIANFSPSAQKVQVTIARGTATLFDRELDMAAGDVLRQVVPLPHGGHPALRARIRAPNNALEADDEAVAWIDRARPISVTVAGRNTDWLKRWLARDRAIRATFVDPSSYVADNEDVAIFVGWVPPEPPSRPALLFAPPHTGWLGSPGDGTVENQPRWEVPGHHRVVQGVDPFTLSIERARSYAAPWLVPVAHSARGTPLVYVSESPERRLVVVTFGPDESNLAGAPGFPVLIGNAIEWLTRPAEISAERYHPGLIAFGEGVARISGPNNERVPLTRVNRAAVAVLRGPGLYEVEGGGARSTIAVNVGEPQVSNLMRHPAIAGSQSRTVAAGASGRAWWIYCALGAFALALAEWWTWQRRITV